MKWILKRTIAMVMVAILVLGAAPLSEFVGVDLSLLAETLVAKAEAAEYEVGDIIEFGSYPQSEVKDDETLSALNSLSLNWVSYGYYSGDGNFGSMTSKNYMKYADVNFNGEKYRAVKFASYRPHNTIYISTMDFYGVDELINEQYNNNYYINTVYWFKYEPIKWRILEPETGLITSEILLDSQPYSNAIYADYYYYNDKDCTNYANDYFSSSIRKWLNEDFYNISFTDLQKSYIFQSTFLNNSFMSNASEEAEFVHKKISDEVFLLSYEDVVSDNVFEFSGNLTAHGSDYAKCQGLAVGKSDYGNSSWLLRAVDNIDEAWKTCLVLSDGTVTKLAMVSHSFYGIRPAMRVNLTNIDSSNSTPTTSDTLKLVSTYPSNGATSFSYDDDIVLTFDKPIYNTMLNIDLDKEIAIVDYDTDEVVVLINNETSPWYGREVEENTVIIHSALKKLTPGRKYYILMTPGLIIADNEEKDRFEGITDKDTWTFSYLNPSEKTGYSLDVYYSSPFVSVAKKDTISLSAVLTFNGNPCSQDGVSFSIADGRFAQITKINKEEDRTMITVKGVEKGSTVINVSYNDIAKTFPVMVTSEELIFRIDELDKFSSYNPFFVSDLYIGDFNQSKKSDNSIDVSFDVYNRGHCYGVVDIYDENSNLINCDFIDVFDGDYPTGIVNHVEKAGEVLLATVTGELFDNNNFTSSSKSKKTSININVPENGYFVISQNINSSDTLAIYDITMLSFDALLLVDETLASYSKIFDKNEVVKNTAKEIFKSVLKKGGKNLLKQLRKAATEFSAESASKSITSIESLFECIDNLMLEIDVNIVEIIKKTVIKTAKDQGVEVTVNLLANVTLDSCGKKIIDLAFYTPVKISRWFAILDSIAGKTESDSAYVYNSKNQTMKKSNGVVSYFNTDTNLVFHSVALTFGEEAELLDTIVKSDTDNIMYYNIATYKDGKKEQPTNSVIIYIPIPEDWDESKIKVFHIDGNLKSEELNVTIENGYAKIETNSFSYFLLVNGNAEILDIGAEIRNPSTPTINYGDSIILHADTVNYIPADATYNWEPSNGNFILEVSEDGKTCKISPKSSGETNITLTVSNVDGDIISTDTQVMTSKAGFFQKLIAFFKKLFSLTKVIPQVFNAIS